MSCFDIAPLSVTELSKSIHTVDEPETAEHYDSEGWDIYFAMSNFKEEGTVEESAKHIKSFFLDLDCGEDKVAR